MTTTAQTAIAQITAELPALTGTDDYQVKWATDLRAAFAGALLRRIPGSLERDALEEAKPGSFYMQKKRRQALAAMTVLTESDLAQLPAVFAATSAQFWIDNRAFIPAIPVIKDSHSIDLLRELAEIYTFDFDAADVIARSERHCTLRGTSEGVQWATKIRAQFAASHPCAKVLWTAVKSSFWIDNRDSLAMHQTPAEDWELEQYRIGRMFPTRPETQAQIDARAQRGTDVRYAEALAAFKLASKKPVYKYSAAVAARVFEQLTTTQQLPLEKLTLGEMSFRAMRGEQIISIYTKYADDAQQLVVQDATGKFVFALATPVVI